MIIVSSFDNARERFEAMQKGRPAPPKPEARKLSDEAVDTFLDRLAVVLAKEYEKQCRTST